MLKTCFKIHKDNLYTFGDDLNLGSELSFEEKVFIHAELTPMAKPKKPSVSTTKVGLVKAQIETAVDSHTGKTRTRYRTYCTKAIVPKDQQRREDV